MARMMRAREKRDWQRDLVKTEEAEQVAANLEEFIDDSDWPFTIGGN